MIESLRYASEAGGFRTTFGEARPMTLLDFDEGQSTGATELAQRIEEWLAANLQRTTAYAAERLLGTKNEAWLDDDEEALDAAAFGARLALSGVNAFSDGSFEIFFRDGGLFDGHSVTVDVDAAFAFVRAGIVG